MRARSNRNRWAAAFRHPIRPVRVPNDALGVRSTFRAWLWDGLGRPLWALVSAVLSLATVYQYVRHGAHAVPWLIGLLVVLLVLSFAAFHRERTARITAQSVPALPEVPPPGGGIPFDAPVEYQVNALRQILPVIRQHEFPTFGAMELDSLFANMRRTGTNPIYEPLQGVLVLGGLAHLVEIGELRQVGSGYQWRFPSGD
jgi:hypothetical protein